jgi:hypothetical protein
VLFFKAPTIVVSDGCPYLWATITQMNCNPHAVDLRRREAGTLIRSCLTGTRFLLTCRGWRSGVGLVLFDFVL